MSLTFTRATKKALKARIALEGPSGSGKTYTALLTARALGARIGLVDTEKRSASLYADLFDFDALELDRFDPQLLIDALAAGASYDVMIVDSLSHFWMGADGMLEQVDRAAKRSGGGNTFAGWKELRPVERRMIDAMLAFPGHLIATLRTKTEWVVEENERGKKVPKKIGLKAEQREGLEYEFTLVAAMDLENTLVVSKSRCPMLAGMVINKPDESLGRTLREWLDAGEPAPSALLIRDEILADPNLGREELKVRYDRARSGGLLGAAIVDEHGDSTTLGEWIVTRGRAATGTQVIGGGRDSTGDGDGGRPAADPARPGPARNGAAVGGGGPGLGGETGSSGSGVQPGIHGRNRVDRGAQASGDDRDARAAVGG